MLVGAAVVEAAEGLPSALSFSMIGLIACNSIGVDFSLSTVDGAFVGETATGAVVALFADKVAGALGTRLMGGFTNDGRNGAAFGRSLLTGAAFVPNLGTLVVIDGRSFKLIALADPTEVSGVTVVDAGFGVVMLAREKLPDEEVTLPRTEDWFGPEVTSFVIKL